MTNDTTTLQGSLDEMKDQLIYQLGQKGVTATYSTSTGLLGLVSKIGDIQTGSGGSSITLSSNKNILSYYDSESATLTATYESGATMELWNIDTMTKIGNFTENSGTYTYTYNSTGDGDINLIAKVGSKISEPILIEDCLFYGINTNAFTIPSNTTFTSDGTKITATTNTSGEKLVYFNHNFSSTDDFLFESELAQQGVSQGIAMCWNNVAYYGGQSNTNSGVTFSYMGSYVDYNHTLQVGDTYRVEKKDGVTSVYVNNEQITSESKSYSSTFKVGFFINRNRTQYYKNIKIKLL